LQPDTDVRRTLARPDDCAPPARAGARHQSSPAFQPSVGTRAYTGDGRSAPGWLSVSI